MRQPALSALCAAALLAPAAATAQAGAPIGDAAFDSSYFAWERGDFTDALTRLQRLLAAPDAARYLRPAAELTGEPFNTIEVTTDGRDPVWNGSDIGYGSGAGTSRRVHVGRIENGRFRELRSAAGFGLAFDDARRALFLRVAETAEIRTARAAVDSAVAARNNQAAFQARSRLSRLEAAATQLVALEVESGSEVLVPTPGLIVQAVTSRPGEMSVYVLAAPADGGNTSDVYRLGSGAPEKITTAAGPKTDPVWLTGERLLYSIDRQNFAIQDLAAGTVAAHRGTAVTVSADGSTVAFVRQDEGQNVLTVITPTGTRDVARRTGAIAAPALSPSGRRVAFQAMPREDWELYVTATDGSGEQRLTREIQHDLLPQFIDENTIHAVMGEARHRRSFLYDVNTRQRTRLFHNNTVRTVAPEYAWVLSPAGNALLVVAERDGDTVSPERGIYVTQLNVPVTLPQLQQRVAAQLQAEQSLRQRGAELYRGIDAAVRAAVANVSKDRIYSYELDLYRFDSKHITQPGNAKAIEYLTAKLRGFGYEPEVQWFEVTRGGSTIRTANVIAKLTGTVHPDVLYTVSSHFDSVERGPGADDDTSGTVALLEAARVLSTRPQAATIHFAFFTGEEAGLLGSREYVRRAVERGDRLVGALNNDMIGFANNQRLDNTIRFSNDGIRDIQHAAAFLFTDLITYDAKYYKSTDAHAYYDAYGDIVGGIGSYPILGNPHYHQTHDELETINHQLVAEVSKTTIATLMQLASRPSRVKNVQLTQRDGRYTVSWEALPEADVREYVVEFGPVGAARRGGIESTGTSVELTGLRAGEEVRVIAVSERGFRGWDWARVRVP